MSVSSIVTPGDYTKKELQDLLNVSESTIERLRKRFVLPDKEGLGRAKLIVIDEQTARKISDYLATIKTENGTSSEEVPNIIRKDSESSLNLFVEPIQKNVEEVLNPFKEIEKWKEKAYEFEKKNIALIGQLEKSQALSETEQKASQAIIEAKQSEIETLKTSLVTIEKTVQGLQASMLVLERDNQRMNDKLRPSIPMLTAAEKPISFWEKLRFLVKKDSYT